MSLCNSCLSLAHTHTHTLFPSPAGREERAPRRIVGRSCCRLHRVNEVPSGRGKTATLSSQSVCVSARTSVCVNMCAWGRGDLSDNQPPPALIGIIRMPRVKGAQRLFVSQSCHTKTLTHLQQKCSRNRTSGRLSSN